MSLPPRPLFLALIPGDGVQLDPPPAWLEAARSGLATIEQFSALAAALAETQARVLTLEAGRNIEVRTVVDNQGRTVAVLEVVADARSYVAHTADMVLGDEHNGRVIEVLDGSGPAAVVVPQLSKGFTALVRATVARVVEVRAAPGVSFVPSPSPVVTSGLAWEEVAVESLGDGRVLVRALAP